jgi:uncharacterized membrane protein YccC
MAIAVAAAVLVDHYYAFTHALWVPLLTALVMYVTVHLNFRQMLQRTFWLFCILLGTSWLCLVIKQPVVIDLMAVLLFSVGYSLHQSAVARGNAISIALLVAVVGLLMLLPLSPSLTLSARMHDVVLGMLIGLMANLLIFPGRPDVDFRLGVISVLEAYSDYLPAITNLLFRLPAAELAAQQARMRVERVLQVQEAFFPDWVYDAGFNPTLQAGHRHFLIKVEQLGQVLFAMHQVARHAVDPTLLREFEQPIERYVQQVKAVLMLFVARLNLQAIAEPVADFADDLETLEKTYREFIQVPLELLDTSQDYIDLAALITDLRDLQKMVMKIGEALR